MIINLKIYVKVTKKMIHSKKSKSYIKLNEMSGRHIKFY
jgi:hypothetical protein